MATIVKLDADDRAGKAGAGLGQLLANMFNTKEDKKRGEALSAALVKLADPNLKLKDKAALMGDIPPEVWSDPRSTTTFLEALRTSSDIQAAGEASETASKRAATEEFVAETSKEHGEQALKQEKELTTADQILRKYGYDIQADELQVRISEGAKERASREGIAAAGETGATERTNIQGQTARDVARIRNEGLGGVDSLKYNKFKRDETNSAIKQIDDTLTKFRNENGIAIFEQQASKAAVTGGKESAGELVARGVPFQDAFSISMGQIYQDTNSFAEKASKDPQQAEIYKHLANDRSILRAEFKQQYGIYPEDFEADISNVDASQLAEFDINDRNSITEITVNKKGTDIPSYTIPVTLINGRIVPLSPTMYQKYGQ